MLSCSCDYDDDDGGWYYYPPDDFSIFDKNKRKRCCSCNKLINIGSTCVCFNRYRSCMSDIKERIYGDEVPLANFFMCEKCGEIYFNLSGIGYCVTLGNSMQDMLSEYRDLTK